MRTDLQSAQLTRSQAGRSRGENAQGKSHRREALKWLRTEIVGHANEEITNSIYTHVRRERVAAVAADFDPLGKVAENSW
jgi:hypothetical protein